MEDERVRRIGQNEALFREVNERVVNIRESVGVPGGEAEFVCECGKDTCVEHVLVPLSDYERIRSDPTLFLIKPGHEFPDIEEVVERRNGYAVVRKVNPEDVRIAVETDPRS